MKKTFLYLIVFVYLLPGCDHEQITKTNPRVIITDTLKSGYLSGDFHQHTTYTDGSWSFGHVMYKNYEFGLNWWVNSEHGGSYSRNGAYSGNDKGFTINWADIPDITLKGMPNNNLMWRWQCIKEFSFNQILETRNKYPGKIIIQGLEWNVPGHEHADVAILANQFELQPNASAIAQFEYTFDNLDNDTIGDLTEIWVKNKNSGHQKTLDAIKWVQANYAGKAWIIPGHPERQNLYSIGDFRDMNNAGPDVCFGFEGMAGHQKYEYRSMYYSGFNTYGTCTYGGVGFMTAKVGGLWDALLSEGRRWWVYANCDFHDVYNDFYPGEYQKNYVFVADKSNPLTLVDGMRSGNCYFVSGDLIDSLYFNVDSTVIGGECRINSDSATIFIHVHDPVGSNANFYSSYNKPVLDHIDVICGEVSGLIQPGDAAYSTDFVLTTKVIARFDSTGNNIDTKGLVSSKWTDQGNGWKEMKYVIKGIQNNKYIRLRGTNHRLNVPEETDGDGNPLADDVMYPNSARKAFADLWFYSNPIFVKVNK